MSGFTIPRSMFEQLVTAVIPHAGKDDMLPVLTCLHFESTSTGALTAGATDRFTFGLCRVEKAWTEPAPQTAKVAEYTHPGVTMDGDVKMLLPVRQIKKILAFTKGADRFDDPELEFVLTGEAGQWKATVTAKTRDGEVVLTVYAMTPDGYPPLSRLYESTMVLEGDLEPRGLNGHYLARFQHAERSGEHIVIHQSPAMKPLLVSCGDHFVGGIMPVRLTDSVRNTVAGGKYIPAWADTITAPKPEEKKATA